MLRSIINKKNYSNTHNNNIINNDSNLDNGIFIKNEYGSRKVTQPVSTSNRSVHRFNQYYITGIKDDFVQPNSSSCSCTDSSCYYCKSTSSNSSTNSSSSLSSSSAPIDSSSLSSINSYTSTVSCSPISSCSCGSVNTSSYNTNKLSSSVQSSDTKSSDSNKSSPSINPTKHCFEVSSKVNLSNNKFIYGIANLNLGSNELSLIQFNGQAHLPNIESTVDSNIYSVVYVINSNLNNPDGLIDSSNLLWYYNGVREDYQYGQLLSMLNGDLLTLSSYTGTVTFTNNLLPPSNVSVNSNDGNYFVARFTPTSRSSVAKNIWTVPISAFGAKNVQISTDKNDNVYIIGTYQGTLKIKTTILTSNLVNDMFIAKLDPNGDLLWIKTSNKNDLPISTGYVRGESLTISSDRITAMGQYSSVLNIQNISIVNNTGAAYILWIAQFDLDGNIIWLTTVSSDNNSSISPGQGSVQKNKSNDYIDGSQIITGADGHFYLTGTLLGNFNFGSGNIDVQRNVIYVCRIDMSGNFTGLNYIIANVPTGSNWDPHLAYNGKMYINFFALGNVMFNGNETPLIGTGTQNMVINSLDDNGLWECGYQRQGLISNPSINISSSGNGISVVGTHIINLSNTDATIFKVSPLVQ